MHYHLPAHHHLAGFRPMVEGDVNAVRLLLETHQQKFPVHAVFGQDAVTHWLLPRPHIMYSYVREEASVVTDFISFYALPSAVVNTKDIVKAAYLFYHACESLEAMVRAAMIEARNLGFHVFNAIQIMDNHTFIENLKFGSGSGFLNYYLYNWRTAPVPLDQLAIYMI